MGLIVGPDPIIRVQPTPGKNYVDHYTTNFPLTEALISEGGNLRNLGLDWSNMATGGGIAWGLQPGNGTTGTTQFSDSYALLTGVNPSWGPDHSVTGTVVIGSTVNDGTQHEVEVFLRQTDGAHSSVGYECNVSVFGNYSTVVRWNGGLGQFTQLGSNPPIARALQTGDTIGAQIVGNIITTFFNGAVIQTVDITAFGGSVWTSGSPGIGMFRNNTGNGSFNIQDVAYSSVTAKTLLP